MLRRSKQTTGRFLTSPTITNRADQILASHCFIADDQVRSVSLDNALISTDATTLCLPANIIAKLGLELLKEVSVMTANGLSKARVFQDANLSLCGREGTFECLEIPEGQNSVVGVFPLELLGLEPDLQNQTLRILPSESANTYLTIL
jgi:predicted aspartyl protease